MLSVHQILRLGLITPDSLADWSISLLPVAKGLG